MIGHEKISNMDYEFFFYCYLNWSIVNTDQESTHECNFFNDDPSCFYFHLLRNKSGKLTNGLVFLPVFIFSDNKTHT
jgi:hypothetical protein